MKPKEYCDRKSCMYWSNPVKGSPNSCNYIMFTGESRIAQIPDKKARRDWANCPCYLKGKALRGHPYMPESMRPIYDWAKGRKLYREGALDSEIAEALGCTKSAVKWWRRQNGLPCNGRINNG